MRIACFLLYLIGVAGAFALMMALPFYLICLCAAFLAPFVGEGIMDFTAIAVAGVAGVLAFLGFYRRGLELPRGGRWEADAGAHIAAIAQRFGIRPVPVYHLTWDTGIYALARPGAVIVSQGLVRLWYEQPQVVESILARAVADIALGNPRWWAIANGLFGAAREAADRITAGRRQAAQTAAAIVASDLEQWRYRCGASPAEMATAASLAAGVLDAVFRACVWLFSLFTYPWLRHIKREADRLAAEKGYTACRFT